MVLDNFLFVEKNIYPSLGKYGLAIFGTQADTYSDTNDDKEAPEATEFAGDREWILDWRPYMVDMTPTVGETAKIPVAELMKNNWLRKIDGSYAKSVGIKATQATALDGKKDTLYWKTGSSGEKVSATIPDAFSADGKFVPSAFWEYLKNNLSTVNTKAAASYTCAIEVKVYVASQAYSFGTYTDYHIPAPWETTETKYSIFIGRTSDCYLVDGYSSTTGEYMRGITAKPLPVGTLEFDPENFRLRRTGIAPGPCTTISNKARSFFYNYVGDSTYTKGAAGLSTSTNSIFYNNGTYPRCNISQYTTESLARSCNAGGSSGNAVPVGEGGYHALNAFLCSMEAGFGTRNLHADTMFGSGISSNSGTTTAVTGGVNVDGTYYRWDNTGHGLGNTNNASQAINQYYPKFQCLEPQIAASLAVEMNIAAGDSFNWNGGDWHWEMPTAMTGYPITGLLDGEMNCRMYKYTDAATVNSKTVRCMLRGSLVEGMNLCGDVYMLYGGGADLIYHTTGTTITSYDYSFYLEPDQTRWYGYGASATDKEFNTTNTSFPTESMYMKLIDSSTAGSNGNAYVKSRTGYTPVRKNNGGGMSTYECTYQYRTIDEYNTSSATPLAAGHRIRRRLVFRGNAYTTYCSPRSLIAATRPSSTGVSHGLSAQVLLA